MLKQPQLVQLIKALLDESERLCDKSALYPERVLEFQINMAASVIFGGLAKVLIEASKEA